MEGVHAYNQGGPDALTFRRTGGRRPFFARAAKPNSAKWSAPPSAPPSARRPPPPSRGLIQPRAGPALDLAPPRPLGARALWAEVLSRDDPRGPAPPQAVVEESQEAARPGRPRAAAGLCRAAPGRAGRRSTRSASRGLSRRGAHPSGRGPRLWLGRARPASLGRLTLAGPVGAGLVLWGVPLQ